MVRRGSGGGRARAEKRGAGDTCRARASSDERDKRGKRGRMQAQPRRMAAQGGRGAGGKQQQIGAQHRTQSDVMPMTQIEPYQPPRPTITELMEGRPAAADDGGIPPKGYLGRPPKPTYRTGDGAQAERRVRAREIQPWRGEVQRSAHAAGEPQ